MAGTLYLVGTPIGNLEDISARALRILREADLVAAEDTRRTLQLLNHFGIKARLVSCHRHNEQERSEALLDLLRAGKSVALVTDAGMPGISDPGEALVEAAVAAGLSVIPVPGPSACLLALAASALPARNFRFAGFLARRGRERREDLARLAAETTTVVIYESPRRLAKTLAELRAVCGGDRRIVVARELTKLHEEFWRGDLEQAAVKFAGDEVKGEVTLVLAGRSAARADQPADSMDGVLEAVKEKIKAGSSAMTAIRRTAQETGWSKNALYRAYQGEKNKPPAGK